jgi:hypothetical protein
VSDKTAHGRPDAVLWERIDSIRREGFLNANGNNGGGWKDAGLELTAKIGKPKVRGGNQSRTILVENE